jgi:hypothetical protein
MTQPRVPLTPGEITPEWLTAALRAGGRGDALVEKLTFERIGEDRGLVGVTVRLLVDGSGTPHSLVAKLALPAAEARERVRAFGIYRREVTFYQEIAARIPLRTPEVFFSAYDEPGNTFVILMEDLSEFRFCDNGEGRVEDVALALSTVAPMHAAFWAKDDLPDWLFSVPPSAAEALRGARATYEERMGGISPVLGAIIDRLPAAALEGRLVPRDPPTLVHGDYAIKNLCFRSEEVVAFDWQLIGRRPAVWDVTRAIAQSLPPEQLADNLDPLLREYQRALMGAGVSMTMASLRDGFFRSVLAALVSAVNIVAGPPTADAARIATSLRTWQQTEQLLEFFDPLAILEG